MSYILFLLFSKFGRFSNNSIVSPIEDMASNKKFVSWLTNINWLGIMSESQCFDNPMIYPGLCVAALALVINLFIFGDTIKQLKDRARRAITTINQTYVFYYPDIPYYWYDNVWNICLLLLIRNIKRYMLVCIFYWRMV